MPENNATTLDLSIHTNVELEKGLIAAMAIHPTAYYDCRGVINEEVFSTTETTQAYNEVEGAYEEGRQLPKIDHWKPVDDHLEAARHLAELWQKRSLATLSPVIEEQLKDGSHGADKILSQVQDEINRIQALIRDQHGDRAVSVSNLFPSVLDDVNRRRGEGHGLKTGFTQLDRMLGGFQPALHILAGSPGLGKTTFAVQVASKISRDGIPVVFLSFDEVLWRLTLKAFCQAGGLSMKKYADGSFNDDELQELLDTYEDMKDGLRLLHFIEGTARFEVPHLESITRQIIRRTPGADTAFVVVDYLQRWAANSKEKSLFRHIIAGMVAELREVAFRLKCPVLVISSLSREGYDDPTIRSLAEAGELEFSADTALLLKENTFGTERMRRIETSLTPRALRLIVAKNRYGDLGEISYQFNLQLGKIEEKA